MNARLRSFLDSFGFEDEFASATQLYWSGRFDAMLLRAAEKYQDIMDVMLPTLGGERQETYSPFLPISPTSGRVLYVPMKKVDAKAGTVTFEDEGGKDATVPVTGGHVKLQWKPDFGMRWAALGVDFEMFGKDHQANAPIYSKICRILGAEPPHQFVYELFLDEKGEKISKSKGNGISVEQWLAYAPQESLALYQWQKPKTAKKLYFDVIPKAVDEYLTFLEKYAKETPEQQLENPCWHIHGGKPPAKSSPVSFAMLLNLVSAANAHTKDVLWGFIRREAPDATPENSPLLDHLVGYALNYYADFVKPAKVYRPPNELERMALEDLAGRLERWDGPTDAESLQTMVFAVGTEHKFEPLRAWFTAIYEVLLGQSQGPRFGGFIALYGVRETAVLVRDALAGRVS
jgi:lysyl-tRNA synthetase class 1